MPCTMPIRAYKSITTIQKVSFSKPDQTTPYSEIDIPCGKCIECKLDKKRQWTVRILNEAHMHKNNSYNTLTYNDKTIPIKYIKNKKNIIIDHKTTINKTDIIKFIKKVRKKYKPKKIRYFACGEYGDKMSRPHYHIILFNHEFKDKYEVTLKDGTKIWRSDELESIWKLGNSTTGSVESDSASYVAGYVTKKITGDMAIGHYKGREPEYATMSRKPGLGRTYYEKYKQGIFSTGRVIINNNLRVSPPVYYTNIMKIHNPKEYKEYKSERRKHAIELEPSELTYIEKVRLINHSKLKRRLEK